MHDTPTNCGSEAYPTLPYRPRPKTRLHSPGLQRKSHVRDVASSIAWLRSLRPIPLVIAAVAPFMCAIAASTLFESSACAQTVSRLESIDRFANLIDQASDRFALPARWIRAVLKIESGGDENAISPRGHYWLISTASLIDYPQQARALRVLRTAGGGVAIQTWMLDHVFPGTLGSISRQLSFIDSQGGRPQGFRGEHLDRNAVLHRRPAA